MHGNLNITKTYSNRSNCVAGARTALKNPAAKIGVDFNVAEQEGRWLWMVNELADRAHHTPVSSPLKEAITAAADAGISPKEFRKIAEKVADDLVATVAGDNLDLPACLKRPRETEEERTAREKRNAKTVGPDREIVMPKGPVRKTEAQQKAELRKDGLRYGSKESTMIDMVTAGWVTEAEVCAKLGWKACMVTLRRACDKVGMELVRRKNPDGGKSQYRAATPKASEK
jgi:hypothetical protein